jgi:3-dehydroquinate dehydratase-2
MMQKIIIINGPNLNLLGEREKEKYGNTTLKKIEKDCKNFAKKNKIQILFKQSNIINAAGYTHTSVAIRDALMILTIPIVELHITNIYNREKFRHKSLISKAARSIICGFGVKGYVLAIEGLKEIIKNENK